MNDLTIRGSQNKLRARTLFFHLNLYRINCIKEMKSGTGVKNNHVGGTSGSQIIYLCLTFYFIIKKVNF